MPSATEFKANDRVIVNLGGRVEPIYKVGRVYVPRCGDPGVVYVHLDGVIGHNAFHPARVCKTATQEIVDAFPDLSSWRAGPGGR